MGRPAPPSLLRCALVLGISAAFVARFPSALSVFAALAMVHLLGLVDELPPAPVKRIVSVNGEDDRDKGGWPYVQGTSWVAPLELEIDLDLPPEERWKHIAGDPAFAAELRSVLDRLFGCFVQLHLASTVPGRLYGLLRNLSLRLVLPPIGQLLRGINRRVCRRAGVYDDGGGALNRLFGAEYAAEMRGIAAAAGLDLGDVAVANAVYEVGGACTSIVAELPDGTIVHGRNFDYPEQYARSVIVQARFVRKITGGRGKKKQKELQYRGSMMLPIVGLIDGVRPGVCSISVNTRHKQVHQQPIGTDGGNYHSMEGGLVKMLKRNWQIFLRGGFAGSAFAAAGAQPLDVSHLIRKTLEESSSFGEALRRLATAPQAGLSYLTVGGTKSGEGAVVTRARTCAADVRTLFDHGAGAERWALVQTNHDHWLVDPVPCNDGGGPWDRAGSALVRLGLARPGLVVDSTRTEDGAADSASAVARREMSIERMWEVIGRVPNMRPDGDTMVSAVMVAAQDRHDVRWVQGLGTTDEYFWSEGGAGEKSAGAEQSSSRSGTGRSGGGLKARHQRRKSRSKSPL